MAVEPDTRQPLSVEAITRAAMQLIDVSGLERLSMRKLGNALGYEAMALYKHVADKQAVIDATVAAAFDEMTLADPGWPWQERLRHTANQLRAAALRHPHLLIPMTTNPPSTTAVIERIDSILGALRDSGAHSDEVTHHFWMFVNSTTGALVAEARSLTTPPPFATDLDDDNIARIGECRALREFGPALAACDFAAEYERMIDTLLALVA
jgi:AcrR family transcriptional regulator